MDSTKKQLLQQFLEGRCVDTDLTAVRQVLKEPDSDKLLDEIICQNCSKEADSNLMDEFIIKRFQWKRQEEQKRLERENSAQQIIYKTQKPFVYSRHFYRIAAICSAILLLTSFILLVLMKRNH